MPYTTYNDSADLNNQPASGTCAYLIVCYSGTANNPFSARSVFLHIQRGSMGSSGYCAMQIGCGDGKTAIKMRVHNGSSWQAWN